ncbi:taurine transport system ATP-binding protein [Alkalibacterium subtropicum]|uniref:Taurine transport system ATP-binding protein n=1 Tax=Alkalibacterium subtropicum TaxID=753702 RepID=A0A1I1H1I1_9LACT|nr:ABC transporter ATP-binding protein [Alkalibacterium subtropicum]SFC15978.1 taurine transport system ATP-binding protein [Alkalibacterium subtropicum]
MMDLSIHNLSKEFWEGKHMDEKQQLINLKNVSMIFGEGSQQTTALENIDLKVNKGEFICVLGPSGCGKSTLLKIIAGYQFPTKGEAVFQDRPIEGPDWHKAVVFQSPTLYPWLTVEQNITFGPRIRGVEREVIQEKTEHILEQIGLSQDAGKNIFELSGGMKQRVALARVLANEPELILMDEPLGALDALTRLNMQGLIRNVWKENGNTVLMITHDVDEAMALGTRVIVMSKQPGRILQEIEMDYTYSAFRSDTHRIEMDKNYLKTKDEILDLISLD